MTDERLDTLDEMFKSNQIVASQRGYEGLNINSFATILTIEQFLEIAEYARKGMGHKDTSTEKIKALRRAFTNVEVLARHLDFSDLTEITGYRYDKESERTYFRIKGRMAVSNINGIATDLNAVRMILGLSPLQEEEKAV